MTKLVSLAGNSKAQRIAEINPSKLDDVTAGIVAMKLLADWNNPNLAGWWTDLKRKTSNVFDQTKNLVGDTINYMGDKAGSAVRLVTDEQVIQGITTAAAAYATNGASLSAQGLANNVLSNPPAGMSQAEYQVVLADAGQAYKKSWSKQDVYPWVIGAGGLTLLYVLLKGK